jgi:hypothetical protein
LRTFNSYTNMATMRHFEVIPDNFNATRISLYLRNKFVLRIG